MADRKSIYETVTNQIIEQLENGVAPWRKPWASFGGGMPANVVSGKAYRGVNVLLLWGTAQAKGFDSDLWATYRQWAELGGHVEKGQKGTHIVFWRVATETTIDKHSGEETEDRRFYCRQYTVFNLDQCGGESLDRFRATRPVGEFIDFSPAEEAIAATQADIRHGGCRAYFNPAEDYVQLPVKESFRTPENYYSTALHELVHWSGHENRLNRLDKLARFGSESYAAEELVAELGASFLTSMLGVPNVPIQDNAAYLSHWLKVLKADSKAIFTASTAAAAASDHILSYSRELEPVETEEETAVAV